MRWAKKRLVRLHAWQLGKDTPMEKKMIMEGRIVKREDGCYEVFSLEATGPVGEIAQPGDYFKVDSTGYPYPNGKSFFEKKHRQIEEDWYEQISEPVQIWSANDSMCEEIQFLLSTGQLSIHPDDPTHYYSAKLWGTEETAAKDAVIVFYEIERDGEGIIQDINFNFVERSVFENTYELLPN